MFPNDFVPRVGHHCTIQVPPPNARLDGLLVRCGVLACEPPSRLGIVSSRPRTICCLPAWLTSQARAVSLEAIPSFAWLFALVTEPEARNINPKNHSSISSFSTRLATILQGASSGSGVV